MVHIVSSIYIGLFMAEGQDATMYTMDTVQLKQITDWNTFSSLLGGFFARKAAHLPIIKLLTTKGARRF